MSGFVFRAKAGESLVGVGIPADGVILLEIRACDLIDNRDRIHEYIDEVLAPRIAPKGSRMVWDREPPQ